MAISFLLLAFGFSAAAAAAEYNPIPVHHIEELFKIEGDDRTFARHVLIPCEDECKASPEGRTLLAIAAGEVGDEARNKGYSKGSSGKHYLDELEMYQQGRWASAYITVA